MTEIVPAAELLFGVSAASVATTVKLYVFCVSKSGSAVSVTSPEAASILKAGSLPSARVYVIGYKAGLSAGFGVATTVATTFPEPVFSSIFSSIGNVKIGLKSGTLVIARVTVLLLELLAASVATTSNS